jgi:hypothetical protein
VADIVPLTSRPVGAALDLVRSMGLVGLVRPATTSAPPRPAGKPGEARGGRRSRSTARLRIVAAGLNAGNIAGGLDAPDRMLPVIGELRPLLPGGGLRRGSTIAAAGATSLVFGLLGAASAAGSWAAVVGMPSLGLLAAAEAGVALDRLALVPYPGPDWSTVAAALLDGFDLVVAAPPGPVATSVASRLAARARQRGSVLIGYGPWPGAELVLEATRSRWNELTDGLGRLRGREMTMVVRGRGAAAARPREDKFFFPWYPPVEHGPRPFCLVAPTADEPERVPVAEAAS